MTPDERWANHNSVSQGTTQHQPEASDPTQMKITPVYKGQSIHSSHLTQPPIAATNRKSAFPFGLECCEFPEFYKPALPDLRQDLTADPYRVNNSGSGLSSPSLLQPCRLPRYPGIDDGLQITPPPPATHWCRSRRRRLPWNSATRCTAWNSLELDGHPLGSTLPHSSWYNTRTRGLPFAAVLLEIPWNWTALRKDRRRPTCLV